MANKVTWDDVPTPLVQIIGSKIGSLEDFIRFSAVCKTWQSVMSERREAEKELMALSPESPFLLLAEEVQGTLFSCDMNDDDEDGLEEDVDDEMEESEEEEEESEEEDEVDDGMKESEEEEESKEENQEEDQVDDEMEDSEEEEEESEVDDEMEDSEEEEEENEEEDQEEMDEWGDYGDDLYHNQIKRYSQLKISVGSARGIYSLSTRKLYTIELPEAAGKIILGTSKGWVLTLGKDFQTNLLHPLLRHEISLPTTRVVLAGNEENSYEGAFIYYLRKAAMSSEVQPNEKVLHNDSPNPTIMIIYGERGYLGYARPGDKVWTKVDVPWNGTFIDIAYHKGRFYGVNCHGCTFVCHFDDDYTNGRHATGTQIAERPLIDSSDAAFNAMYLVDSGCDLWLLVRLRRIKHFKPPNHIRVKYCTTGFLVWKLEEGVSEDGLRTEYTWTQMKNLDNKAFFVGRNSSVSLPSSSCVSPNSIYFTDDARDLYFPEGGGHDMGVYNMESGTIVPHFQGKSVHPISPPLWLI